VAWNATPPFQKISVKNLDDLSAKNWRRAVRPGSARAYAIAVAFVGVATALRWALGFLGPEIAALPTFYPAFFSWL
jgi:hypothetical protein